MGAEELGTTPVRAVGAAVDAVLLRIPGLKWWAWYALMEGKRV